MFKRKRTDLIFAYCLLATAAIVCVVHDAKMRGNSAAAAASIPEPQAPAVPLAITRLADSPFLNPRSESEIAANATAPQGSESTNSRQTHAAPFGVYFLRVAIQADSDEGTVTFAAGTQVRLVRRQDGKLRVTRNGTDFFVKESQVTNDLDAVAAIAGTSS
jgi:hypothetical protein